MEKLINEKTRVRMEIVTPTSVGAGAESDWSKGVDFIVKDGVLYHLNMSKMAQNGIDLRRLATFFIDKNDTAVAQLLGSKLDSVSDFKKNIPCSTDNDIKAFVRNQLSGRPIIPGSSLKGAIRSIMFQWFRTDEKRDDQVFGKLKGGEDFMRFVKVSDFEFEDTTLVNTKIYNLQGGGGNWQGGWKHTSTTTNSSYYPTGFNTIYESLVPKDSAEGYIMISELLFNTLQRHLQLKGQSQACYEKKKELFSKEYADTAIENMFNEINSRTYDYLSKERDFFTKFSQGEHSDIIINSINRLMNQINDLIGGGSSSCIIKMAAGSGFHSITGDWQFDDFYREPLDRKRNRQGLVNPKSRKIAIRKDKFELMGFVKLSII